MPTPSPHQKLALQRMPRPAASECLLSILDGLREDAMAGKIVDFALVANGRDDDGNRETLRQWSIPPDGDFYQLLGDLEMLKSRLIGEQRIIENPYDPLEEAP